MKALNDYLILKKYEFLSDRFDDEQTLMLGKLFERFAVAKNGKNGVNGVDGVDGKDGKDGIDGKDGKDGRDGEDGRDGKDGRDGEDGKDGTNGKNGKDGITKMITETVVKIKELNEEDYEKIARGLEQLPKDKKNRG